jgi:hypothetical protein
VSDCCGYPGEIVDGKLPIWPYPQSMGGQFVYLNPTTTIITDGEYELATDGSDAYQMLTFGPTGGALIVPPGIPPTITKTPDGNPSYVSAYRACVVIGTGHVQIIAGEGVTVTDAGQFMSRAGIGSSICLTATAADIYTLSGSY